MHVLGMCIVLLVKHGPHTAILAHQYALTNIKFAFLNYANGLLYNIICKNQVLKSDTQTHFSDSLRYLDILFIN